MVRVEERFIGNSFFCFLLLHCSTMWIHFLWTNAVMANNVTIKVAIRDAEIGKSFCEKY